MQTKFHASNKKQNNKQREPNQLFFYIKNFLSIFILSFYNLLEDICTKSKHYTHKESKVNFKRWAQGESTVWRFCATQNTNVRIWFICVITHDIRSYNILCFIGVKLQQISAVSISISRMRYDIKTDVFPVLTSLNLVIINVYSRVKSRAL